jgi:hypothetical protein
MENTWCTSAHNETWRKTALMRVPTRAAFWLPVFLVAAVVMTTDASHAAPSTTKERLLSWIGSFQWPTRENRKSESHDYLMQKHCAAAFGPQLPSLTFQRAQALWESVPAHNNAYISGVLLDFRNVGNTFRVRLDDTDSMLNVTSGKILATSDLDRKNVFLADIDLWNSARSRRVRTHVHIASDLKWVESQAWRTSLIGSVYLLKAAMRINFGQLNSLSAETTDAYSMYLVYEKLRLKDIPESSWHSIEAQTWLNAYRETPSFNLLRLILQYSGHLIRDIQIVSVSSYRVRDPEVDRSLLLQNIAEIPDVLPVINVKFATVRLY